MPRTSPPALYALSGLCVGLLGGGLSQFMDPWLAWLIGGSLGIVPIWFAVPRERRVFWRALAIALAAGIMAGLVAALIN